MIDSLLHDLSIRHERDVPLGPRTWYGVGGPAKVLVHPSSVQQLSELAARCHEARLPVYVLGRGANLLVLDQGVDGVVIELDDPAFKQCRIAGAHVSVGAGYDLPRLVMETAKAGLAGLECLAGIPASLGGAVRMNAGGTYGEIGSVVRRVQLMDDTGQVYYRDRSDLVFAYRHTNITARYILDVDLELTPGDAQALVGRVREIMAYKKSVQPMADHSAGCAFKNPAPAPDGRKLSAGKLIDQAGLKGFRIGTAQVSTQHANFVVADKNARAADILAVIEHVHRVVLQTQGIDLQREVVVWPEEKESQKSEV